MTYPRAHLVDPINRGFYHCISRCVRRGWLCGHDEVTGRSYEHRKAWLESRILHLSTCFAVDLYGYAIMSNHYHLVLELIPERPRGWCDEEVARRWLRISGKDEDEEKVVALVENRERLGEARQRLGDLSWFMRFINEAMARRANREDECKGRFWEGRFKSFALLDEEAVLAGTAYVDLNPIRAKLTERVECAPYTSVKRRLSRREQRTPRLASLSRIGIELPQYIELLRWTVAATSVGLHGARPSAAVHPRVPAAAWLVSVDANRHKFRAYGSKDKLRAYARRLGQQWLKSTSTKSA